MFWWRNPAVIGTQKPKMQRKKITLVPAYVFLKNPSWERCTPCYRMGNWDMNLPTELPTITKEKHIFRKKKKISFCLCCLSQRFPVHYFPMVSCQPALILTRKPKSAQNHDNIRKGCVSSSSRAADGLWREELPQPAQMEAWESMDVYRECASQSPVTSDPPPVLPLFLLRTVLNSLKVSLCTVWGTILV